LQGFLLPDYGTEFGHTTQATEAMPTQDRLFSVKTLFRVSEILRRLFRNYSMDQTAASWL
jgi:hypothetical protein